MVQITIAAKRKGDRPWKVALIVNNQFDDARELTLNESVASAISDYIAPYLAQANAVATEVAVNLSITQPQP